jgi:protein phosphatase
LDYAKTSVDYHGMGTTVVGLILVEQGLVIGHIGDSRAYRFYHGQLEQLTQDHSLVEELLKKGQISLDEAERHPHKHILMRALGTERHISADLLAEVWDDSRAKEIFLLCTDGLTNAVDAAEIKAILSTDLSAQGQVDQLVAKALENGGDDNISVVIIHRN